MTRQPGSGHPRKRSLVRLATRRPHRPPVRPVDVLAEWLRAMTRAAQASQAALSVMGKSGSALGEAISRTLARWEAEGIIVRQADGSWTMGNTTTWRTPRA